MTRRTAAAGVALGLGVGLARAARGASEPTAAPVRGRRTNAGELWRFETAAGAVRVLRPRGARLEAAAVVVYVHGLYTDVDGAWREHALPAQFLASGRNALFVAAPGRRAPADEPPWPKLAPLLDAVTAATGLPSPPGPLALAGHSGAYSQLATWLDDARVKRVLLVDGLYGRRDELRAWLDAADDHRMAAVGHDTARAADEWAQAMPYAIRRRTLPHRYELLSRAERTAKLLVAASETDHMALVRDGWALPLLLRWAGLPARG
jgi:hypothetical protein